MMYVKMIMEQTGASEEVARKIFNEMCGMDISLSGASKAQLRRAIKEAAAALKECGTI